ncbi:MAG: extensin family protein [Hyphomicrobiales bacterium]|nr:extensin family protein [Hyphomicrobiales bacterium]
MPEPRPEIDAPMPQPDPEKPKRIYQSACPALIRGRIRARLLGPIIEGDCGERSPLALEAIMVPGEVRLSSLPQINCRTASAMADWVEKLNKAAEAAFGSSVSVILSGIGYQCRRRNNQPDGRISEHGFANAIDITGFRLESGEEILVKRDWGDASQEPTISGLFLRTIHKAACENFTTVLGPDADQYHSDHLHFDLGCHGKNCRYLICE